MAYDKFIDSSPINDDTGDQLPALVEKNLQALRDGLNMGHLKEWEYSADGSSAPADVSWSYRAGLPSVESAAQDLTWSGGHVATIIPKWQAESGGTWYTYGTETMTWDASDNLTSTTWSGSPTLIDFEDGKPGNADPALQTVDYIRENLMSLRDCIVFGAMNGWDYRTWVGVEEPQYITWEKGVGPERVRTTLTWSSGRVDTEYWQYRPASATGYTYLGTKTYTYDADSNVVSAIWSGTPTYVGFDDDKPINTDTGNTVLTDIKNNLQGLRDGILYGSMDFWDYSKADGTGTAEMPQYYFLKKGALWLRATNTWGASGGEMNNISSQEWDYSEDSGSNYDEIGTISTTYNADGYPTATTWS